MLLSCSATHSGIESATGLESKKTKQLWRNGETAPEKCSFTNFPRHEENKFN